MVTDSLQNLEQYRGLHKNMDTVIDFLKKCDLTALPDGKTGFCQCHGGRPSGGRRCGV